MDAERFLPERWLGEAAKDLQKYFMPFSAGGRGCIGRNISYLEQAVLLSTMVWRYELELPTKNREVARYEAFNTWPGEVPLSLRSRIH